MARSQRPNIILIITDQQRYETVNALGYPYMETPHLDRLTREGTTFTQCHCTAPSCAPSRASLFTGNYPHDTGVWKNGDEWPRSWVQDLHDSGYYCANIGKMHTNPFDDEIGFDERWVVENKDRFLGGKAYTNYKDEWDKSFIRDGVTKPSRVVYRQYPDYRDRMGAFVWPLDDESQSDMYVGRKAETWLRQDAPSDQPFFLEVGLPGPHPPYDPPQRFLDLYRGKKLPWRRTDPADVAGQPRPLQQLRQHNFEVDHDSVVHLDNPSDEQLQQLWEHYLANVSAIDEQVGAILDAVAARGETDNTIIMFTSDHGEALGDHGHIQKWTMYESVTRVPLIAWGPGHVTAGQTRDGLCALMDVGASILDWAGVTPQVSMQAQSLRPATTPQPWSGRDYVIAEHGRDMFLYDIDEVLMLRTPRWKWIGFDDGACGQLFDLENDPSENTNLWGRPAYENIQALLHLAADATRQNNDTAAQSQLAQLT
jgi:arylsulfatase